MENFEGDMRFSEVEFKYNAESIDLQDFLDYCKSISAPKKYIMASGYDYFYAHIKDPASFCRHRVGPDSNQLTFKRKTADKNNFIRTEHNLNLEGVRQEQVHALCSEFGYLYAGSLFKNCFIYTYDRYTLVYYICYDHAMEELGRFVEIEMSESYPWESDERAYEELKVLERDFAQAFDIAVQSRVKRSLYEMYVQP